MSAPQPPPTLAQRLALILYTLRHVIAAHAGTHRSAAPIVLLAWGYLHRVARRFEALANRAPTGETPAPARVHRTAAAHRPSSARLPYGFAWLIRLAPTAAPLGGQLRHLLADPEFSTLLAANPRAGRILRPLCWMLGVRPDPGLPPALFQPPPRSRAPEPPAPEPPAPEPPALEPPALDAPAVDTCAPPSLARDRPTPEPPQQKPRAHPPPLPCALPA